MGHYQWYHLGLGEFTTHCRTYCSGDWDVHRGYGLWVLRMATFSIGFLLTPTAFDHLPPSISPKGTPMLSRRRRTWKDPFRFLISSFALVMSSWILNLTSGPGRVQRWNSGRVVGFGARCPRPPRRPADRRRTPRRCRAWRPPGSTAPAQCPARLGDGASRQGETEGPQESFKGPVVPGQGGRIFVRFRFFGRFFFSRLLLFLFFVFWGGM